MAVKDFLQMATAMAMTNTFQYEKKTIGLFFWEPLPPEFQLTPLQLNYFVTMVECYINISLVIKLNRILLKIGGTVDNTN